MTERNKDLAIDIIEYSMCGLVPIDALSVICDGEEELRKYAALREEIIVGIAEAPYLLFMREGVPRRGLRTMRHGQESVGAGCRKALERCCWRP